MKYQLSQCNRTEFRSFEALRRVKGMVRKSVVVASVFTVLGVGGLCLAQKDAEAQKFLAAANAKELEAQKQRADAALKQQEAATDEAKAAASERMARIFEARAMQFIKADANKQRAFHLRNQARDMWRTSHSKAISARITEQKALQARHDAEELLKAAAEVKDQAAIGESLQNDAKAQASEAQTLEQSAATDKAAAEVLNKRAETAWAEAEKLDSETHRALAPKPTMPVLTPPTAH